jgi:hypothetical protein
MENYKFSIGTMDMAMEDADHFALDSTDVYENTVFFSGECCFDGVNIVYLNDGATTKEVFRFDYSDIEFDETLGAKVVDQEFADIVRGVLEARNRAIARLVDSGFGSHFGKHIDQTSGVYTTDSRGNFKKLSTECVLRSCRTTHERCISTRVKKGETPLLVKVGGVIDIFGKIDESGRILICEDGVKVVREIAHFCTQAKYV